MPEHFHRFAADTMEHGGATMNVRTGEAPQEGFMVGQPGWGRVLPETLFSGTSAHGFAVTRAAVLAEREHYLGSWHQPPKVHLDVAQRVDSLSRAVRLGVNRREQAIGEFRAGQYQGDINLWDPTKRFPVAHREGQEPFRGRR